MVLVCFSSVSVDSLAVIRYYELNITQSHASVAFSQWECLYELS